MPYSRTLLFIHFIYNSLHLLTPTSHSIHPPTPSPWQPHICFLGKTYSFVLTLPLICQMITSGQVTNSPDVLTDLEGPKQSCSSTTLFYLWVNWGSGRGRVLSGVSKIAGTRKSLSSEALVHRGLLEAEYNLTSPWFRSLGKFRCS